MKSGKQIVAEAAKRAVERWENYAKGGLPHSQAGTKRIEREFAPVAELIETARVVSQKLLSATEPVTGIDATNLAQALAEVEKVGGG